jgi:hypothetical protein
MQVRKRNVPSEIAAFWHRVVKGDRLAHAVRWRVNDNDETVIEISDRLPYLPFLQRARGRPSFAVSMSGFLPAKLFGASENHEGGRRIQTARGQINRNENKERGRTIFMEKIGPDGNDEMLVGMSFHVDESTDTPLILRAIALRTDSPEANALSRAAAGWLLFYLAEASRQIRGVAEVGADTAKTANVTLLHELGFRNRTKPAGFTASGTYIAFRPPGS